MAAKSFAASIVFALLRKVKFNRFRWLQINDASNKVFKVFQDHPTINFESLVHLY